MDWETKYREEFQAQHKGTITKTYAQIEKMRADWDKNCCEPIRVLGSEISDFQQSVGIESQPKDLPDPDDPKAEEKFKVIAARMEKAYAENEKTFKEYEAKMDKLQATSAQELEKIQKVCDELKVYLKNKLTHAGELCPMCKGKGKISEIGPEKKAVYEDILMRVNFA